MIVSATIFILTISTAAYQILGLIELPSVRDNDVFATELAIRDITNRLFDNLQLRPSKTQTTRLKRFSTIHNYLVSLTLKDYDNLKEIAKIARVDNGNDKAEQFIGVINEILNEVPEDKNNINVVEADVDKDVISTVNTFLDNLEFLKKTYSLDKGVKDLNKDLFHHLELENGNDFATNPDLFANMTFIEEEDSEEDDKNTTVSDASDFWQPSGRRIFKGERTYIKYFPFMASVQIFGQFQCAGSIIKSDLVITAASCLQLAYNNRFFRENPKFLSVRVGSSWYMASGEVISVIEVYFHPRYDPKTLNDNIAIMRLRRWIKFSKHKKRVKKIRLDPYDHALPLSTAGIATAGWGAKSASNVIKDPWINQLSYAILDIYDLEDCRDVYTTTYVTKKHFCAGFMSHGGGACNKDVGGPGIVDGVLAGIVSFGSPVCGAADTPTVFTKVGFYRDWIEGIMKMPVHYADARTTPANYETILFEPSLLTTTTEPTIQPITSTKYTQYPTWTLSAEVMSTKNTFLTSAEKAELFERFLNSVFESEEKREKERPKFQYYNNLLRFDTMHKVAKAPEKSRQVQIDVESERQGYNLSSAVGYTRGIDVNEPIVPATTQGATQISSEDETAESTGKSGTPVYVQKDELTDAGANAVPDSGELERDNAQLTGDEMKNEAVMSVESSPNNTPDSSKNVADRSESSEGGLSLASFEDLTLRFSNSTDIQSVFGVPKENLYDIISERLSKTELPKTVIKENLTASEPSELDRKSASAAYKPVQPRRNVQRITRFLNL